MRLSFLSFFLSFFSSFSCIVFFGWCLFACLLLLPALVLLAFFTHTHTQTHARSHTNSPSHTHIQVPNYATVLRQCAAEATTSFTDNENAYAVEVGGGAELSFEFLMYGSFPQFLFLPVPLVYVCVCVSSLRSGGFVLLHQ
jgi:hypothetical protein